MGKGEGGRRRVGQRSHMYIMSMSVRHAAVFPDWYSMALTGCPEGSALCARHHLLRHAAVMPSLHQRPP